MVFLPPSWVPKTLEPPDTIAICDYVFDEQSGRHPLSESRPPFTCAVSGTSYSITEVQQRIDFLSRGLAAELGWERNAGSEWDKVACIFSLNSINYLPLSWAIQRLNGICTPANAAYSAQELEHQLRDCSPKCIFTSEPLLPIALQAAKAVGLPPIRVYFVEGVAPAGHKSVDDLVKRGRNAKELESLQWSQGQGARQVAFVCYSSGTSGLPKGVLISHRNVIAEYTAYAAAENFTRHKNNPPGYTENSMGPLPMSHIIGLMASHLTFHRGDGVIVSPKFDMLLFLSSIQKHKVAFLWVVPPIIVFLIGQTDILKKFDLSSVKMVTCAGAPLGKQTADALNAVFPKWSIRQGYGMTECSAAVTFTSSHDVLHGSCGSLIHSFEARIVTTDGRDAGLDERGELIVRSPTVALGYLNNEKASKETFLPDGWLRTGDEAMFCKAPSGNEHLIITDRMKELIKVKAHQVAPAELEAHILAHPDVVDCCSIPVSDRVSGEVPKAYVVRAPASKGSAQEVAASIKKHVEDHKAKYKWLNGGVEFIHEIPKGPSGKILRRILRDREQERGLAKVLKLVSKI